MNSSQGGGNSPLEVDPVQVLRQARDWYLGRAEAFQRAIEAITEDSRGLRPAAGPIEQSEPPDPNVQTVRSYKRTVRPAIVAGLVEEDILAVVAAGPLSAYRIAEQLKIERPDLRSRDILQNLIKRMIRRGQLVVVPSSRTRKVLYGAAGASAAAATTAAVHNYAVVNGSSI